MASFPQNVTASFKLPLADNWRIYIGKVFEKAWDEVRVTLTALHEGCCWVFRLREESLVFNCPFAKRGIMMSLEHFRGFGTQGFRSFGGDEIQFVGPMKKVHLLVGQNNAGKSNALHFMHNVMSMVRGGLDGFTLGHAFPERLDTPEGWDQSRPRIVSIGLRFTDDLKSLFGLDAATAPLFPLLLTPAFSHGTPGDIWFDFEVGSASSTTNVDWKPSSAQFDLGLQQLGAPLSQRLDTIALNYLGSSTSDLPVNYREIVRRWAPWKFIPQTGWVNAIRAISTLKGGESSGIVDGNGLVEELASLQHPDPETYASDTAKFAALQRFVMNVLEDQNARVEIPEKKQTILVHFSNGRVLPIQNLGTGISEVIFLAAVATLRHDQLICIEEPEVHLHPTLQRKLIQYINSETTNHYLISTHSAQLLDSEIASISHVKMEGGWTTIEKVETGQHLAGVVFDLGNRASDLVQSNFIIWVEGPSDRIYVSHWLQIHDPELLEGAHFTIMFYGGVLLRHLSADDKEATEFIQLLQINRQLAIVIDSDKSGENETLNATKQRVIGEFSGMSKQVWVTEGYTIENYIPHDVLKNVFASEYPGKSYQFHTSQYESPLKANFDGLSSQPSKVTVARGVVKSGVPWQEWPLDLRTQIAAMSESIRVANGLPLRSSTN